MWDPPAAQRFIENILIFQLKKKYTLSSTLSLVRTLMSQTYGSYCNPKIHKQKHDDYQISKNKFEIWYRSAEQENE